MAISRNCKDGVIKFDQRAFLSSMLKKFGIDNCKPVSTPLEPNTKFEKNEKWWRTSQPEGIPICY